MGVKRVIAEAGYRVWSVGGIENGLKHADKLQREGGGAILNILGEHHNTGAAVERDLGGYLKLLDSIAGHTTKVNGRKVRSNARVSVKATQFGLDAADKGNQAERESYALENMWSVVERAADNNIRVEMDIEKSSSHEFAVRAYKEFTRRLHSMGKGGMLAIALQANYNRRYAMGLLKAIADLPESEHGKVAVRLTKGIYTPKNDENALDPKMHKDRILETYKAMTAFALNRASTRGNLRVALASHRTDMHDLAQHMLVGHEKQMLKGIRTPFRNYLVRKGYGIWEYTPIAVSAAEATPRPGSLAGRAMRSIKIERGRQKAAGEYAERRFDKAVGLLWRTGIDYTVLKYLGATTALKASGLANRGKKAR